MTNETITYKIGRGLVDLARATNEGLSNILYSIKKEPLCFTYPILGNLSEQLQERIEKATHGKYDKKNATEVSALLNCGIYGFSPVLYGLKEKNLAISFVGGLAGSLFGILEVLGRIKDKEIKRPSLVGKVASLPLEAILGVYDGIKGK